MQNNFYKFENNILTLNILATAGAKQDSFGKIVGDRLKISVKKAAENGEATKYMIKFLAKSFDVNIKDIELLYGETSPNKAFYIKNPKKIPEKLKGIISF